MVKFSLYATKPDNVMREEEEKEEEGVQGGWRGSSEIALASGCSVVKCGMAGWLEGESRHKAHRDSLSHPWLCGAHGISFIFNVSSNCSCFPHGFMDKAHMGEWFINSGALYTCSGLRKPNIYLIRWRLFSLLWLELNHLSQCGTPVRHLIDRHNLWLGDWM